MLKTRNNLAQTLTEYALILAIVGVGLSAMNVYVKRSLQAKVKNMSDRWISAEQGFKRNDTYVSDSSVSLSYATDDSNSTLFYSGKASRQAELIDPGIDGERKSTTVSISENNRAGKNMSFYSSEDFEQDSLPDNSTINNLNKNVHSINKITDMAQYLNS